MSESPLGFEDLIVDRRGIARFRGRSFSCSIGRGGLKPAADKREGDGATPAGVWRLEEVYFRPDRLTPPSRGAKPIRPWMRWSDDPQDPAYNSLRSANRFSAELMRRADPMYDLVGVIDHNRHPPVPGMGSAVFLHLRRGPRRPTAGCVAFARKDLLWILRHWTPRSRLAVRISAPRAFVGLVSSPGLEPGTH